VDDYGRPLYGDVFGSATASDDHGETVDKTTKWGTISAVEAEEFDEASDDEAEAGSSEKQQPVRTKPDLTGTETPTTAAGIASVSTAAGWETPDIVDLRKRAGLETPDNLPKDLYQVLQEKVVGIVSQQFFSTDKAYVLPSKDAQASVNPEDSLKDVEQSKEANDTESVKEVEVDGAAKRRRRLDSNAAVKRSKDFKF
jgi:splicing factor 3B subunit 2